MKNFKLLLIALLGFGLSLSAQTKKATNTLLWEISGKGLKKPSYLFGTHHLINRKFADTMRVLQDKLKSVDGVVEEFVMDSTSQMRMVPFLTMKNNTLDSLLTPAEYKEVNDYIKAKNPAINLKQMNRYKPAAIDMLISLLDKPEREDSANDLEDSFQQYAESNAKSMHGLETVEYQAALLLDGDLQKQKKALLKSIRESDEGKPGAKETITYYRAQDMDKLADLFKKEDKENDEFMTEMLKNRNQHWLDQLPALMEKESLFIAVGAAHLVGHKGLIKGLQAKGYTLKPIATN